MLPADQIAARVAEKFGASAILASKFDGYHPWISVSAERWVEIAQFVRNDPALRLDLLRAITGIDYPDKQQIVASYDLLSFDHRHEFCIKVFVGRDKPEIPSVSSIWKAADWHERETYDLLGIVFTDHPDSVTGEDGTPHPRRILLPDDWKGFPLRKDYAFPREYQGIPGSVEIEWAQKSEYPK